MNILLTQQAATLVGLQGKLVQRGHQVRHVPLIRTVYRHVDIAALDDCPWWLFTSKTAVRAVLRHIDAVAMLNRHRVAAVGEGTAQALREAGVVVALVPEDANGASLAAAMLTAGVSGPFAWPCGARALPDLAIALQQAGHTIRQVVVYETIETTAVSLRPDDVVVVTSPSAVDVLARLGDIGHQLVAIGPTTAHAAALWGYPCRVSAEPSEAGILAVIDDISAHPETSNRMESAHG